MRSPWGSKALSSMLTSKSVVLVKAIPIYRSGSRRVGKKPPTAPLISKVAVWAFTKGSGHTKSRKDSTQNDFKPLLLFNIRPLPTLYYSFLE
jgi:hypothetical protein